MTVAAPSANGTSRPAAPRPIQSPPSALELIRSAERPEAEAATPPASDSAPAAIQAQPPQPAQGFSPEQLAALAAPLDRAKVRQREQGRSKVHYLEGWQVIVEANRIFGFDGWQRQTLAVRCVNQAERLIGRDQKTGWVSPTPPACVSRSPPVAARPWSARAVVPAMASTWIWARPMNPP
jgi:hypothetical protein